MGPDGSVELYDALTCITHARDFIGNKPGLLLMAMFPSYGKSRFEIAFVFPSVDGPYKERKARGEIVPRNRWIDKLTTRSAQNALRPDGKELYVNPEMVPCNLWKSALQHQLKSGKSQSNPSGRTHVHMACIDDESEAALTHVPAGRDALLILAFLKDQDYGIRLSEERTALTDKTIEARNIVAAFEPDGSLMASNKWIMKKNLSYEDYEMYDTKIREFADAFFNYVNSTKHSKEKDTSSETKKRRHSTDQDEAEEETMEPSGERSVKPKVIVKYHNSENLEEFIQELKGIYLETDLNKKDAEEELAETKANLSRFMNKFNKDPRSSSQLDRVRESLIGTCRSNLGEEEFYFPHRGECPTMDEHKQAQPGTGYPIKLPLGLKKLRSHDDPEIIRAYADILGSLMQPTDRPPVDYLKMHEFTSSIAINMLTLNHGNLTRNPRTTGRCTTCR